MFYGWDYPYSLVFHFIFFALAALLCFSLIITALFDSVVIVQNYIVLKYV